MSNNELFLPERGVSSLEKAAQEMRAEEMFIELLRLYQGAGRNVSHSKTANNFAPATFANEPEAKKSQIRRKDFEAAMIRLFSKNRLVVETYGPPSRTSSRLVERDRQ
jgi:hypothetical protein